VWIRASVGNANRQLRYMQKQGHRAQSTGRCIRMMVTRMIRENWSKCRNGCKVRFKDSDGSGNIWGNAN
jgi:hypothetical protein